MTATDTAAWELHDLTPEPEDIADEVVANLASRPRTLPCKLLYDQRGSELFEQICEQPEYYPTRTELAIMRRHAGDMARRLGPGVRLVELGSGASTKTPLLLERLDNPVCYVPVEISKSALTEACERIAERFPDLPLQPVVADYTRSFELPPPPATPRRTVAYFPGSTIGNFHRDEARDFLRGVAELVGPGGALLIGVDRRKGPDRLLPAYDDEAGVTAAFNLNMLLHINRQTGSDFDPEAFHHEARWNDEHGRVEMHLVADRDQTVRIRGEAFDFAEGETIWTESSYKHSLEGFAKLAEPCFDVAEVWCDDDELFSVQCLEVRDGA
ncbi:MAG: L-histidine N(alpha)-methyltransferase [Phycisphaeraceae bacterium]